jgi:uncharacterized membrane protein
VSKERARAREARTAARRAEVEAAARRRAKAEQRQQLRGRLALPKRRRRYGALTDRELAQLVAVFLGVQVVASLFVASWRARAGVAVLTLAVLLVLAATRRSTSR